MPKDQQNIFLILEFKKMLLEINSPFERVMYLFVKDIMRDDNAVEKVQYKKRKNSIMHDDYVVRKYSTEKEKKKM